MSMRKAAVLGVERIDVLIKEHRTLDERLRELGRHAYLTPEEQVEVKQIKKLKLAMKDRIADLRNGD